METIEDRLEELRNLETLRKEVHEMLLTRVKGDLESLKGMGFNYTLNGLAETAETGDVLNGDSPHASAMKERWMRFKALGGTGLMTKTKLAALERKAARRVRS